MSPATRAGNGMGLGTSTTDEIEVSTPPADLDEHPRSAKRPLSLNNESDKFTRRKRARLACHFCRLRKAKCDNKRPTCSFCAHHDARCVYSDQAELDDIPIASLPFPDGRQGGELLTQATILERLDEIKTILTHQHHQTPQYTVDSPISNSTNTVPAISAVSGPPEAGASRCESLLNWPILESAVPVEYRAISSFPLLLAASSHAIPAIGHNGGPSHHRPLTASTPLSPDFPRGNTSHRQAPLGLGIQESALVPLCRKFLREVHSRNPILDSAELLSFARDAAENGVGWDSRACLVLIACALALSCPQQRGPGPDADTPWPPDTEEDAYNRAAAEAYFLGARKRIGLSGTSIIDIQCLFFASIYERYSLRIVPAWLLIQQACSRLQVLIQARGGGHAWGLDPNNQSQPQQSQHQYHLEQRVFWSVFKAESELLSELGLRPSGLADLAYPDSFPSPPANLVLPEDAGLASPAGGHASLAGSTPGTGGLASSTGAGGLDHANEMRSWFFYCAEISLRRTLDSVLSLLYRGPGCEEAWLRDPARLVRQHGSLEEQISLWYSHLPPAIRFETNTDGSSPASLATESELAVFLRGRFQDWRELILRPLLYCALHGDPARLSDELFALARQAVGVCADIIAHNAVHHRHGLTWFVARRSFLCALLILAVVRRAEVRLPPPLGWEVVVRTAMETLRRWGRECEDLERLGSLLETVMSRVVMRPGG